nr:MAG TPA: hypothetical protein [Caudoviricetes sp.]
MMINDDQHDEHDDDHVMYDMHDMHDMHTNTMHHARHDACRKGKHNTQTHKHAKMHKNKRNVTKTCKA